MSAMRLIKKEVFYDELHKCGFSMLQPATEGHTLWQHSTGQVITLPHDLELYPDYLLETALRTVNGLYTKSGTSVSSRSFSCEKQQEPA